MQKFINDIVNIPIQACLPDESVKKELKNLPQNKGKKILIAIGKAAFQMAKTALESDVKFDEALVITKYGYTEKKLDNAICFEAGHPIPDENTIRASEYALNLVRNLSDDDLVLMLISGGGSSLFEIPLIDFEEIQKINKDLLKKGANIVEINTIRKRLSKLKGGKFAKACYPATVFNIILSDVIGNRADMIASGPTFVDKSTSKQALDLVSKYKLKLSDKAYDLMKTETVKDLPNVITKISGSVDELCLKAKNILESYGYKAEILTTSLGCEAREAGFFMASIAKSQSKRYDKKAYIFGGETVVKIKGKGKGGRNQELSFAAALGIENLSNVRIISYSSDGTDGPTDAAGGFVDGNTMKELKDCGISFYDTLENNDTYHALDRINHLIKTGPTGTNVNDISIIIIN
ncbi:glycerate kinase [Anaerococcus sp. AGMB00486]|uniref:Glycerate kinase n=2 Tax=Anaerococcus TaxID=165779 RepID=A0ABX2NCP7_9FIRM|nr:MULTISPECIES: glycerate kinase [Anaerococcus]MSS78444.1 glycerate kinase [Anaerococcus porci]NVF12418.1 glycerate kinase [Anaerococcus faecalis]